MNPYMAPSFAPPRPQMPMGSGGGGGGNNMILIMGIVFIVVIIIVYVYGKSQVDADPTTACADDAWTNMFCKKGCKTEGYEEYNADYDVHNQDACTTLIPTMGCTDNKRDGYSVAFNTDDGSCGACIDGYNENDSGECQKLCDVDGDTGFRVAFDCSGTCKDGYEIGDSDKCERICDANQEVVDGECVDIELDPNVGNTSFNNAPKTATTTISDVLKNSIISGWVSPQSGTLDSIDTADITACHAYADSEGKDAYTRNKDGGCVVFNVGPNSQIKPAGDNEPESGCTNYNSLDFACTEGGELNEAENTTVGWVTEGAGNKKTIPGIYSSGQCWTAADEDGKTAYSFNSQGECKIFNLSSTGLPTIDGAYGKSGCADARYKIESGCKSLLPDDMGVDKRYFGGDMFGETWQWNTANTADDPTKKFATWQECRDYADEKGAGNAFKYRTTNWSNSTDATKCQVVTLTKSVYTDGDNIQSKPAVMIGCIESGDEVGTGCGKADAVTAAAEADVAQETADANLVLKEAECADANKEFIDVDNCGACLPTHKLVGDECLIKCDNYYRKTDGTCSTKRCADGYNLNYMPSNPDGEKYSCTGGNIADYNNTETVLLKWYRGGEGSYECDGDHGWVNCKSDANTEDSKYELIRKVNNSGNNKDDVDQYEFRNIEQGTKGYCVLREDNKKWDCTDGIDSSGTAGNNFKIYNADSYPNLYYIKDKNENKWCHVGDDSNHRIYCDRPGEILSSDKAAFQFFLNKV